jgi:hypothetical protein
LYKPKKKGKKRSTLNSRTADLFDMEDTEIPIDSLLDTPDIKVPNATNNIPKSPKQDKKSCQNGQVVDSCNLLLTRLQETNPNED